MLNDLSDAFPEVRQTFERASAILNRDLWTLVSEGPEAELNQTQNTQPVMLAAGVAVWEVWNKNISVRPAWMAGHSLGEYTALVCSGAIAFEEAILLVEARAKYMQEAVPEGAGAMAAILGLDDNQVIEICRQAAETEIVSAVNFNAPGQVVIAGHAEAVKRAAQAAKEAGAKRALILPVSVPSHCELMKPAAENLDPLLQNSRITAPTIPLIHNVDVASHNDTGIIRSVLREQLYKPVRWVETVIALSGKGVTHFVECGPGKVLTGLDKRIAKDATHLSVYDPESLTKALEIK